MTFQEAILRGVHDPLIFAKLLWPHITFYDKQREIIYSVRDNIETMVPAGNMLGKDFVAGFIAVWFYLTRHPCRIITTSAKDDHLRVLWGEIGRLIQTSKVPLDVRSGGPLILKHQEIAKVVNGKKCPISYLKGLVASPDSIAAMQGHHVAKTGDGVPRTLFITDESSSVPDDYYKMGKTWFNRSLVIGNTWPCENYFKKGVKEGDFPDPHKPGRYYRKIIKIRAVDSPNVRIAEAEIKSGRNPSGRMLVPGVKDWEEYQRNLATWDAIQICVSLNADFYEGADAKLYPPDWLHRAMDIARGLGNKYRQAEAIGIDPGEGSANTTMTAIDRFGIIEQKSQKTPDTNAIIGLAIEFMNKHRVPPEKVCFDRGGGGKQHADRMEAMGYPVKTVGFGESVSLDIKRGLHQIKDRIDFTEERYAYRNRRAEMYGILRELLDPSSLRNGGSGFAIPQQYQELLRQLTALPLWWDEEGRMYLPPKQRKSGDEINVMGKKIITINTLLGCSPDEADSLVIACFMMMKRTHRVTAGAVV